MNAVESGVLTLVADSLPAKRTSVSKRLKKNALFSSLSFVFIAGTSFLTLPFIIGKMNFEVFGIYTLLTSLFGYFGIFDLGLGQGLIKFISEYHATKQYRNIVLAINTCLVFQLAVGVVVVVALLLLAPGIVRLLNVSQTYAEMAVNAFRLSLLGLFISLVSAIFSSVLMGLQRYDITASVDSITNFLLNLVLVLCLYLFDFSLYDAVLLSVVFACLTLLAYIFLLHKHVPYFSFRPEFDTQIVKRFIRYSINIFLSKVSALFSNHLVRFVLSYFLTPSAVTFFVVPQKLLGAINGMLSNGANTLFPHISSLHAQDDLTAIKVAFQKASAVFAALSVPVMLFVALYSKQILGLWMGTDFAESTWVLLSLITISSLIGSFSAIPNLVILGMGNSRLIAFFSVVSIVLYLVLLPILTAKFGLPGCAIALLITSVVTIIFVFKYTLRYVSVGFWDYVQSAYAQHLLPMLCFASLTLLLKLSISLTPWQALSVGCALVSAYYYVLYKRVYLPQQKHS